MTRKRYVKLMRALFIAHAQKHGIAVNNRLDIILRNVKSVKLPYKDAYEIVKSSLGM